MKTSIPLPYCNSTLRPEIIWFEGFVQNQDALIGTLGLPCDSPLSEILTASYERFASSLPLKLLGEYSLGIGDPGKGLIVAFRDPSGAVPTYYSKTSDCLHVSNRIIDLVDSTSGGDFDLEVVYHSISRTRAVPDRTHYKHIKKLPPGHRLEAGSQSFSQEPFWIPEKIEQDNQSPIADQVAELRALIEEAVLGRIGDARYLGLHLSGGLDSSLIAAIAATRHGARIPCYSWQPPPSPNSQAEDHTTVESISRHTGLQTKFCPTSVNNIIKLLGADSTVHPICLTLVDEMSVLDAASKAKRDIILSGYGGDEYASNPGHAFWTELALTGNWGGLWKAAVESRNRPWSFTAKHLVSALDASIPAVGAGKAYLSSRSLGTPVLPSIMRSLGSRFLGANAFLSEKQRKLREAKIPYLSPDLIHSLNETTWSPLPRPKNTRNSQLNVWRFHMLQARIEAMAEYGLQHGIRYRYPLLDRAVLEKAIALPPEAYCSAQWGRLAFRKVAEPYLPSALCWHRSKNEPARRDHLRPTVRKALEEIGSQLRMSSIQPRRAEFIDMPRLLRDLEPDSLAHRTKFGKILLALAFLDF